MDTDHKWRLQVLNFTREAQKEDRRIRKNRVSQEAELEEFLAEGWEPFAVNSSDGYFYFSIWLRKLVEK
jgi:hypothetical protein